MTATAALSHFGIHVTDQKGQERAALYGYLGHASNNANDDEYSASPFKHLETLRHAANDCWTEGPFRWSEFCGAGLDVFQNLNELALTGGLRNYSTAFSKGSNWDLSTFGCYNGNAASESLLRLLHGEQNAVCAHTLCADRSLEHAWLPAPLHARRAASSW